MSFEACAVVFLMIKLRTGVYEGAGCVTAQDVSLRVIHEGAPEGDTGKYIPVPDRCAFR